MRVIACGGSAQKNLAKSCGNANAEKGLEKGWGSDAAKYDDFGEIVI